MTEKRKQELKQLIEEAMGSLVVQQEYNAPLCLPVDVYRRYMHERWKYFGLDRLSPLWIILTLDIGIETAKSRLTKFIREELAQFLGVDGDSISVATYFISSNSAHGPHLHLVDSRYIYLDFILRRLLDIALVRGAEAAVSTFHRCSRPEGSLGTFQRVSVVNGIKLKTDIDVCRGIRLVPLLKSDTSAEVARYYPNFLRFSLHYEFPNFFGQTLLAIDQPGLSMFHKPRSNQEFPQGLPVRNLPFKLEAHDVGYQDLREVESFRESFSQALSLTLIDFIDIPRGGLLLAEDGTPNLQDGTFYIQLVREGLFLADDRTFSPRHESITSLIPANRPRFFTRANEDHIEQAKCLHERLVNFNSKDKGKLLIAIDRWIKSKASGSEADKIIDLGIALEALYVPDGGGNTTYKLAIRAARYLGKDKKGREDLLAKFKQIYNCRSKAVHAGLVDTTIRFGEEKIDRPTFIAHAQDLCLQSIKKILDDGKLTDWDSLILSGEIEEADN